MNAIKTFLLLMSVALPLAAPAGAASFKPGRGISLDIWVTWPGEDRWGDREALLPFPEWRRSVGVPEIRALKAAGFSMVRIPVDPAPFLSSKTEGYRDALLASVLDSVHLVTGAGLKVIIDLHAIPAGPGRSVGTGEILDDARTFDAYVALVRKMAQTIAREDPAMVALELMNEPVAECGRRDARRWTEKLRQLWAAARASALETTLVLSGACWGSADGLVVMDPADFPDRNLLWSFHSYAPFILTHQGAGWTGDISPYATGLPYPPYGENESETRKALEGIKARVQSQAPFLRRASIMFFVRDEMAKIATPKKLAAVMSGPFSDAARWADSHGVARSDIVLGEFGMIRQEYENDFVMKPEWRAAYYRDMIALAERFGFAWSMWGYGGAFGIVESFSGAKAEPDVLDLVRGLD